MFQLGSWDMMMDEGCVFIEGKGMAGLLLYHVLEIGFNTSLY